MLEKYQITRVALSFFPPLLFVFIFAPIFRNFAYKIKLLDYPGDRKIHTIPVPRIGGLVIFLGMFLGIVFFPKILPTLFPILCASSIILILGLVEDFKPLSARVRIFWQIVASTVFVILGERVSFLPSGLIGDIIEVIITIVWLVGVTNAYNYLDGLDGLAAGSAAINLTCFSVILFTTEQNYLCLLCIILIGACLGFLPHNFDKKKVFLGDAGSTFLGFILAAIGLSGHWAEDNYVKICIPIIILGVPIFDMIFTTFMRIRDGKVKTILEWLRYSGKDHFHHYLVDLGLSPYSAVIFVYFITASLGITAIMVSNDQAIEAFMSIMQAGIIFGIIATLIVVGRRRRDGWKE